MVKLNISISDGASKSLKSYMADHDISNQDNAIDAILLGLAKTKKRRTTKGKNNSLED